MSELKIGSYVVETELYYEALVENGITEESQLKILDDNGDGKLTEDELQEIDPAAQFAQEDQLEDIQDKLDKLEEDFEEKMLVLDKMEEHILQERQRFQNVQGAAGSDETSEKWSSKVSEYSSKLLEVDEKRMNLTSNYEDTKEELEDQMEDIEINGAQTTSG